MLWILRTLAVALGKYITLGEYERIRKENKLNDDYQFFIFLMKKIADNRSTSCKIDETSKDCPHSVVIDHYHQKGRTSDGTAPLRIFTIVGSDGQIINVQCFDLMQVIRFTVMHNNGTSDVEDIGPSDAMKRIAREAGLKP